MAPRDDTGCHNPDEFGDIWLYMLPGDCPRTRRPAVMCDQGMHKAPMHTPAAPQTAAFRHSGRMPRSGRLSTADGLPLGVEIEYQICCTGHAWSTDGGGVAHASPVPLTRERALTYVGRGWPRASYGPGPIPVRALADQWQQEQPQPTSAGPVTSGSQRPRHNGD